MRRIILGLIGAIALVMSMALPAGASTASHSRAVPTSNPIHIFPTRSHAAGALGSGNLVYHGGQVQVLPDVYLIFWGKFWKSSCPGQQGHGVADENYLKAFFNGRGTSTDLLSKVMDQYSGTHFGGDVLKGTAFDCANPPASASQGQIGTVAANYALNLKAHGRVISKNTQIIVVSPHGTNPGGGFGTTYCAWHSTAFISSLKLELSYTNEPYMPDAGANCGAGFIFGGPSPALQGWSIVAGHEFAESVNDPQLNAWYDTAGYEIGDKCAWTQIYIQALPTGHYVEQPEWSNTYSTCMTEF